jgi:periplasmic divalent cation tolerance protein
VKSIFRNGELILAYVTAPNRSTARRIGRALVEERLAACVNVWGNIDSVYRWKGTIEQGREVAFVVKTRRALLERMISRIKELHPYETPCVVALSISGGYSKFLQWLWDETAADQAAPRD